ncbi:MAG TPA: tyrosine-type recombinase/integrase [Thermaerobacter sp.]
MVRLTSHGIPEVTVVRDAPLPEPMEQYLESKRVERGLSHSTLAEYRRDLVDFCRWLADRRRKSLDRLGGEDLAAVDRDLARKWLAHLDDRHLAPATRARRLSSVGGCFRWLAAEGLIPRDPFASLERPIAGERHKRLPMYLSEAEAERLLRTVLSDEGLTPRQKAHHARLKERDYALITVLLYQGLRIGEAVSLRLGDVDFQEGTVRVIGKGDKERLLPLHRRTRDALEHYLRSWPGPRKPKAPQDPLWWTLTGRPLTKNAAQVAVKRHLMRAGLWRASAHKLRHTFGTRLAEAGVDLLVIKDLLGHATVATTQIYAHVAQRRLREAMERLQ